MRRSTLLELSGMELHEVAHVRRCFAGELAQGVRHAVVTPLSGQLGHGRQKWMRVRVQGGFELAQGSATRLKAPLSQISWPVSTLSEIAEEFASQLRCGCNLTFVPFSGQIDGEIIQQAFRLFGAAAFQQEPTERGRGSEPVQLCPLL